jgi:hypothetical protein
MLSMFQKPSRQQDDRRNAPGLPSLARFCRDTCGGVMVYTGFILPVLLGVSGLSVDAGLWYTHKRSVQAAADSAAIAGALGVMRYNQDPDKSDISQAQVAEIASASAAENGYGDGDKIEVNYPPTSGTYAGTDGAVEVIIRRRTNVFLAWILMKEDEVTVAARGVAVADVGDGCMWALNKTEKNAIKVSGGAQVNLPCGVLANSNDPDEALGIDGGGCLTASSIKVVGGANGDCINPGATEGIEQLEDPMADLAAPSYGACDDSSDISVENGDDVTLSPGVYCGNISVSGGTLTFEPGQYVLDQAALKINGGEVNGDDVSFYITENSGSDDAIGISSQSTVNLSAPWDGQYAGVLFHQDRNSPSDIKHMFTGQANLNLEGILYFPNQALKFAGGSTIDPVTTYIVADTIEFTGNTEVADFDNSVVQGTPLLISVTLVE